MLGGPSCAFLRGSEVHPKSSPIIKMWRRFTLSVPKVHGNPHNATLNAYSISSVKCLCDHHSSSSGSQVRAQRKLRRKITGPNISVTEVRMDSRSEVSSVNAFPHLPYLNPPIGRAGKIQSSVSEGVGETYLLASKQDWASG